MSSKHSGLETTITLCLSLMIIVTIIGNILVCLSVVLVRKLRSPSNYLLVSLAISDLCVAILVMPLALNLEVKGYWDLGPTLCDMWVSFDVTSCTASILNLCMISVDRYLTITKPLTYGVKRTTKRMTAFIAIVWVSSCLISVPPLLVLGNEHGTDEEPSCQVSQHIVYQLYATLGAFYIPLGVMIILYYKIYGAAKSVVDAELRSLGHTTERLVNSHTNSNLVNQHNSSAHSQSTVYHQQHSYASRYFPAIKPLLKSTLTASNKHENCSKVPFPSSVNYDIQPLESINDSDYQAGNKITENSMFFSSPPHQQQNYSPQSRESGATENFNETNFGETKSSSSPTATQVTLTKSTPRNGLISCKDSSATTLSDVLLKETLPKNSANISHNNNNNNNNNNNDNLNSNNCSENTFHSSLLSSYKRVKESMLSSHRSQSASSSPSSTHHSLQSKYHCIVQQTQGSPINSTNNNSNNNSNNNNNNTFCSNFGGVRKSLGDRLSFHATMSSGTEKRRTSSMLKERKASITLGVIMTAFTACWLPFFILALLRPFSVTVNQIPHWISSLCYWLGLANSMLNPIIYVTFHHDFRKAFRYLLCLQCSTMDFRLRERAYQSQYGINNSSDNHLHHLTSYQYYTHPGHHPPPPHNHHTSSHSQLSCSPINQPQPPPPPASQSNPISTSWSTPSTPAAVPVSNSTNRSADEKKTLALKENLIPVNYSSQATLEPLTSSSVDERLISQQEHLLSKHTPL
ncbi:uncharacterized protein LOC107365460 [Tetranychus urticae]|uniref:G-protein coupled receptors family 1 profile domain-containing protein n=1 Tax=Tetranychus urticae TaxID=32264 RepID=T1KMQ9_TETUR|nr:uncharacterized protein LOC107365460 [Tetranychus urticae]XP_025017258.1 uncharacterized protein LOC107365460 [Tetranychus urticae]